MSYPKLVRDNIIDVINKSGKEPVFHIANDYEYEKFLFEKIIEEIEEFSRAKNEEEFADMLEVIEAMSDHFEFDREKVRTLKTNKRKEKGSFNKRIILDEIK